MSTETNSQNGGFAHMIKRIWNGPEEEGEATNMQSEKTEAGSNYAQRNDANRDAGSSGNRPFRSEFPRREPERAPVQYERTPGQYEDDSQSVTDATVISRGTVITGDIKSDGDIEMYGAVTGSINTTGKVKINGKQSGDVQGSSINLTDCTVRGSVNASDTVLVDSGSVIVGDIKCGDLTFDGKLKGNVHVMGNVNCKGNAIIIGDITSTTITVDSGARLQGTVQISDGSIDQINLPDDFASEAPKK